MGYSAIVSLIKGKQTCINDTATKIESISFDSVWSGGAHDNLTSSLKIVVNNLKNQDATLSSFCTGLTLLQSYKDNKEKIASLTAAYNYLPNEEENASQRSTLSSEINSITRVNNQLRKSITEIMDSIGVVSSTDVKKVSINCDIEYAYEAQELKEIYNSGLSKLGNRESLYTYYDQYDEDGNLVLSGKDYVEGVITNVQNNYSGREAAVNSALAMLQLAADKGVKLDYEHKGTTGIEPYVPTSQVASGVDCNPWTSWCVDKGTPGGFQWRPVESFKSVGETLDDWAKAQPGDVFVIKNDTQGHVGIIIENNPETGEFLCAEARGDELGIMTNTRTYKSMQSQGYQVQDMTNVYNGTENTNRAIFDQYVNWETYQRQV